MKPKVRRHHTADEPDQQESAFFKKIIAYQRKLLVLQNMTVAMMKIKGLKMIMTLVCDDMGSGVSRAMSRSS